MHALIFIALGLFIGVTCFQDVRFAIMGTSGEPAIFSRAKAGHRRCEGCHSPQLLLAELAGQPFISDIVLECDDGLGFGVVYDLVLLSEEPVPKLPG